MGERFDLKGGKDRGSLAIHRKKDHISPPTNRASRRSGPTLTRRGGPAHRGTTNQIEQESRKHWRLLLSLALEDVV